MTREHVWLGGLAVLRRLVSFLPSRSRQAWAARIGGAVGLLFPEKYRAVKENLGLISRATGRTFRAKDVFRHFGMTLGDFFLDGDVSVRVEGRDHAEAARAKGRGVIFLTSHLGHWELGGRVLAGWGWDVTAVYQPYRSRAMQKFIQDRRAPGLSYLAVGKGAAVGMGKILHRGGAVALLGDRPFGEEGTLVSVFGRPMRLPLGPFILACRDGAAIVPGFVIREKPGAYATLLEEPLWPRGKGREAVRDLLDKTARILENYLSRYGDQWYCFEPAFDERARIAPAPGV
jgi:lauroyl/myristoyl acyltransferase